MEYNSLESVPYYTDSNALVASLGYSLVELRIVPSHGQHNVRCVITRKDAQNTAAIGVDDCAKVHRILLPRFEALLQSQDVYMEVTSPGMERVIKNAAEFALFTQKLVRLWDTDKKDWVAGKIISNDESSITIQLLDEKGLISESTQTFSYEKIAKAKLLHT